MHDAFLRWYWRPLRRNWRRKNTPGRSQLTCRIRLGWLKPFSAEAALNSFLANLLLTERAQFEFTDFHFLYSSGLSSECAGIVDAMLRDYSSPGNQKRDPERRAGH